MTREEWDKVKAASESLYGCAKLRIDGYEITLKLERVNTYKNAVMVYIEGIFKFEWIDADCEERRRFMQHKQPYIVPAKQRAEFKKMKLSKAVRKKYAEYYERRYDVYTPQWKAFAALKKHLIANNESIELIECGPYL